MIEARTMKDHRSLFRQLLQGMYDAVLITDPSGHILDINARATEDFQYEISDVKDAPIVRFIPGIKQEIVERVRARLEEGRRVMLDARCLRRDGTVFFSEVTISLVDLLNPGDLVFQIRNTERRRSQLEDLCTKECAYNVAQAALFACAEDGRFRFVNAAFLEMFDLASEEEAQKMFFSEIFDEGPVAELFAQALAGETVAVRLTAQEDGSGSSDVEIQLGPNRPSKKVVGVVGSVVRV